MNDSPRLHTGALRPFGISVVIPSFNRTDLLLRAVHSVTTSHPGQVEIVVIDDCSQTDPRDVLPSQNSSGVPLRCYRFARNRGPQAARNLGIRRARYSHIAFLDSDDAFLGGKIDVTLAALQEHDHDVLVHAVMGMHKCNRLGRLWSQHLRPFIPFHWWAALYNPAATPGLVVRRQRRLGRVAMRHSEDWFFVLRYLSPHTSVTYLDTELATVFRAQGTEGGLSGAAWRMRRGEFSARAALLRHATGSSLARYALGTLVGLLRVCNDLIRARYWR